MPSDIPDFESRYNGPMLEPGRWCYAVFETQFDPGRGYVPSVVVADEGGHYPLRGNGEHAEPWYWGLDFATAQAICAKANTEIGLSEETVESIKLSSIAAQNRDERYLGLR